MIKGLKDFVEEEKEFFFLTSSQSMNAAEIRESGIEDRLDFLDAFEELLENPHILDLDQMQTRPVSAVEEVLGAVRSLLQPASSCYGSANFDRSMQELEQAFERLENPDLDAPYRSK